MSKKLSHSYVDMPSDKVKALCQNAINVIEKERKRLCAEVIDKIRSRIDKWQNSFLVKILIYLNLYKKEELTDEILIGIIELNGDSFTSKHYDLYRDYDIAKYTYEKQLAIAKQILAACEYSTTIQVNTDDLYWIS
jgi:hypothetical protein